MVHEPDPFTRSRARSESAANPKRALIEMRKKFRADYTADREIDGEEQAKHRGTHGHKSMLDRPFHRDAVARFEEFHDGIAPFAHALAAEHAG